ncbi:MAG: DNA recombination/repair protein RecA [Chloroflexi bacterium]|nr:DNA recombination/repair protein RecA [Chloroflexota bacterium]
MKRVQQQEQLQQVVAAVQQRWGAQALQRLAQVRTGVAGIPTGHADLDRVLGSGLPRGAVTCLSGTPTSGKTTLALDVLARVQAEGEVTVYIDLTQALDPEYAEGRGVDLAHLLVIWPHPSTLALDITRDIVTSGGAGLVVVDTGRDTGWSGASQRTLMASVRRSPYAVLCLSDDSGGALAARADVHLRAQRQRWHLLPTGVTGCDTRLTVVKSRFGPPGQSVTVSLTLRAGP